jgi:hypothetical protein
MLNRHRITAAGAVIAALAFAGPVAAANAAPAQSPVQGAYQAGANAALDGFQAGAAAAQSGWQAGSAALQVGSAALQPGSVAFQGPIAPVGFPGFMNLGPTGPMGPLGAHGPLGGNGQVPTGVNAWNLGPSGPLGPGGQLGHGG